MKAVSGAEPAMHHWLVDEQASNQMVMSCKRFIDELGEDLYTQPLSVVDATFNDCLQLHADYRHQFQTLRFVGDSWRHGRKNVA